MTALKRMLGPKREEIWRQLAAELGAEYVAGGFWRGDKVVVRHGLRSVTLDLKREVISNGKTRQVVRHTRMRVRFLNPAKLRFVLNHRDSFRLPSSFPGMEMVEIGDREFDRQFSLHGTDEETVRRLFAKVRVRELWAAAPKGELRVRPAEPEPGEKISRGTEELQFLAPGRVKEIKALKALFELFEELLQELS